MDARRGDEHAAAAFSPSLALLALSRRAERELTGILVPLGLTLRTYGLLGHISSNPGLSLSELARRSGITVQSTHALIGGLVSDGTVVSRVPSAGMPAQVSVTDAGRDLLATVAGRLVEIDDALFGAPEMRPLSDGLRLATDRVREQNREH